MLDPGFKAFYTPEAAPKEILSEGEQCFDYILSKYQGEGHNQMGESYQSIADMINETYQRRSQLQQQIGKSRLAGNHKNEEKLLNLIARQKMPAVLTIRNRHMKGDMTLSKAIRLVKESDPGIVLFDCLFCRSTLRGGSQAVSLVSRV